MELGPLFKELPPWSPHRVPPSSLATILSLLLRKHLTTHSAKSILLTIFQGDHDERRSVEEIMEQQNLRLTPLSQAEYKELARAVVEENPKMVRDARREKGGGGKVGWFVGQIMARGREGCVEPGVAERVVREVLGV